MLGAAGCTGNLKPLGITAVMAHKVTVHLVVSEGDTAIGAFNRFSAVNADAKGGIAPPVDKDDGLFTLVEILEKCFRKLVAQRRKIVVLLLHPHIHDTDVRQSSRSVPLIQRK